MNGYMYQMRRREKKRSMQCNDAMLNTIQTGSFCSCLPNSCPLLFPRLDPLSPSSFFLFCLLTSLITQLSDSNSFSLLFTDGGSAIFLFPHPPSIKMEQHWARIFWTAWKERPLHTSKSIVGLELLRNSSLLKENTTAGYLAKFHPSDPLQTSFCLSILFILTRFPLFLTPSLILSNSCISIGWTLSHTFCLERSYAIEMCFLEGDWRKEEDSLLCHQKKDESEGNYTSVFSWSSVWSVFPCSIVIHRQNVLFHVFRLILLYHYIYPFQ